MTTELSTASELIVFAKLILKLIRPQTSVKQKTFNDMSNAVARHV